MPWVFVRKCEQPFLLRRSLSNLIFYSSDEALDFLGCRAGKVEFVDLVVAQLMRLLIVGHVREGSLFLISSHCALFGSLDGDYVGCCKVKAQGEPKRRGRKMSEKSLRLSFRLGVYAPYLYSVSSFPKTSESVVSGE